VGAASKRSVFVDHAEACFGHKQGAGAVFLFGETMFAGATEGFCSDKRFPCGEVWRFTSELELAAFRPALAVAFERTLGKLFVNGFHLCNGLRISHDFATWFGHTRLYTGRSSGAIRCWLLCGGFGNRVTR
jgi:hypothetical protein